MKGWKKKKQKTLIHENRKEIVPYGSVRGEKKCGMEIVGWLNW